MPDSPKNCAERDLQALVQRLPKLPGVYLMKDSTGEVLYVGKARVLANRVRSYFNGSDGRYNIPFLLARISDIQTITTTDERQALLLEMDLIRQHKPRYNIRLKDDRAPYLVRIDQANPWPRLELVRSREDDGASYFGPFPLSFELFALLDIIREAFPLRTCTDRVLYNRVRPCLEFQIKRCLAPCCLDVNRSTYQKFIEAAQAVLEGRNEEVESDLQAQMEIASSELRFEEAAILRDRLNVLRRMHRDRQTLNYKSVQGADALGIYREGSKAAIALIQIRQGRLSGGFTCGFEDIEIDNLDVIEGFLEQYYSSGREIPEIILLPQELPESEVILEWLKEIRGSAVSFSVPQRGPKERAWQIAMSNARDFFLTRYGRDQHGEDACRALQEELGLAQVPRIIECADISHFQGSSTVASIVCFQDGQPLKKRYRVFHLTQEGKPDDFASMREVIGRHLSRSLEENTTCDLLVIDGGPQQLAQGLAVREELCGKGEFGPTMIGLAKKRSIRLPLGREVEGRPPVKPERVYLSPESPSIILKPGSAALSLLERIRDEAHRFAITFHRRTRSKRMFRSLLDSVPGIGKKRRECLLRVFSSTRIIAKTDPKEISKRCGIPLGISRKLVEHLKNHGDRGEI